MSAELPVRDHMSQGPFYAGLDVGIRFAVRVLHAAGIDTVECCQGGQGHAFAVPTVDLPPEPGLGFAALAALATYGLDVCDVSIVWSVEGGMPTERRWRITLRRAYPERSDATPNFVTCYRATLRPGLSEEDAAEMARKRGGP